MSTITFVRILIRLAGSPLEGVTLPEGWVTGGDGMAVYEGNIELRRLTMEWSRGPSGGTTEDRDMCTFHFVNLTGGVPDSSWATADYAQVETAADAFWEAIRGYYLPSTILIRYRWHRAGPAWEGNPAPYNPSQRDTARSVAGNATATNMQLPPQVALSVTERNDQASRRWGRFYLPAPVAASTTLDSQGRVVQQLNDGVQAAAITFYNACRTGNQLIPVVYSRPAPERTRADGTTLPARGAEAHSVDTIQVDNLWDVMRSRRYSGPTYRKSSGVT